MREQETRKISFNPSYVDNLKADDAYDMSDFSSWGAAPDLKIKPEITAPGGNIYSSLIGNQYGLMSGTSMASPHIAGLYTDVKQYVNSAFPNLTDNESYALINSLLMSTAVPGKDKQGVYFSPRKQGAGLVNVENAIKAKAYLSVDTSDKPKAELGYNEEGTYSFNVTIHNISDKEQSYTLYSSGLIDNVNEDGLITLSSSEYSGKGINVSYSNNTVAVPTFGETTVTVNISLDDALKAELDEKFKNGTYVEGFIFCKNTDGIDLSLPYLGFYGDWAEPPIFDGNLVDGDYHVYGSYVLNGEQGNLNYAGQNIIRQIVKGESYVYKDRYVISPNSLGKFCTSISPRTGALRNPKALRYSVINKQTGEVVKQFDYADALKSFYLQNAGVMVWLEGLMVNPPSFEGYDENGNLVDDGIYTMKVEAEADGTIGDGFDDEYSFDFTLDTKAPVITDYSIVKEGDKTLLKFTSTENHYLSGAQVAYDNENYTDFTIIEEPDKDEQGNIVTDADGNKVYNVTIDLTDLMNTLEQKNIKPKSLYLEVIDYAMNLGEKIVELNSEGETGLKISLSADKVEIKQGEEVQINAVVPSELGTADDIEWSSSDETIATVSETGLVTGIKDGVVTITATSKVNPEVSATIEFTVGEPGFVIKDGVLTSYTGKASKIIIPEGVTEIANSVFSYKTNITSVKLPSTLKKVGNYAFSGCSALESVDVNGAKLETLGNYAFGYTAISAFDMPETVTEIGDHAFTYSNISSIKIPQGVKELKYGTFFYCNNLTDLQLSEGLETIGQSAIYHTV